MIGSLGFLLCIAIPNVSQASLASILSLTFQAIHFLPFLHRTGFFEYRLHRFQQDAKIQPRRPLVDILQVQLHHFLKIRDVASAADLPHTGNPRAESHSRPVVECIFIPLNVGGRVPTKDMSPFSTFQN